MFHINCFDLRQLSAKNHQMVTMFIISIPVTVQLRQILRYFDAVNRVLFVLKSSRYVTSFYSTKVSIVPGMAQKLTPTDRAAFLLVQNWSADPPKCRSEFAVCNAFGNVAAPNNVVGCNT